MTAVDVIKYDRRPKYGKACNAEEDRQRIECVKVAFVGSEVSKIALGVLGDTEEGSDLCSGDQYLPGLAKKKGDCNLRDTRYMSPARHGT